MLSSTNHMKWTLSEMTKLFLSSKSSRVNLLQKLSLTLIHSFWFTNILVSIFCSKIIDIQYRPKAIFKHVKVTSVRLPGVQGAALSLHKQKYSRTTNVGYHFHFTANISKTQQSSQSRQANHKEVKKYTLGYPTSFQKA